MAAPRLISALRRRLASAGCAETAAGARAYMKSAMPHHGVPMKDVRRICREVYAELSWGNAASWRRDVLGVWRAAKFREERYAAMELADHRRARPLLDLDALPMLEEMIVTGAWWDLVDPIATHLVAELVVREPRAMKKTMLAWAKGEDHWKRRAAILCQIPRKAGTDRALLYACIEPSIGDKDFFLRKAIGWALRQLAWSDPDEVRRYVDANGARLSPLSVREALKNVGASATSDDASASAGRRRARSERRAKRARA